jgi:hypothetical protein
MRPAARFHRRELSGKASTAGTRLPRAATCAPARLLRPRAARQWWSNWATASVRCRACRQLRRAPGVLALAWVAVFELDEAADQVGLVNIT